MFGVDFRQTRDAPLSASASSSRRLQAAPLHTEIPPSVCFRFPRNSCRFPGWRSPHSPGKSFIRSRDSPKRACFQVTLVESQCSALPAQRPETMEGSGRSRRGRTLLRGQVAGWACGPTFSSLALYLASKWTRLLNQARRTILAAVEKVAWASVRAVDQDITREVHLASSTIHCPDSSLCAARPSTEGALRFGKARLAVMLLE